METFERMREFLFDRSFIDICKMIKFLIMKFVVGFDNASSLGSLLIKRYEKGLESSLGIYI